MSTTTQSTLPSNSILLREDRGSVTTLTLNRPESGNSLSHALVHDLQKTFREIAQDSNVRVVVLTATGKLFCTGHDLKESLDTKLTDNFRKEVCSLSKTLKIAGCSDYEAVTSSGKLSADPRHSTL